MQTFGILISALATASVALAGQATIKNSCSYPIYLWTAGDSTSPMTTIKAGQNYTEEYLTRAVGGISMKMSKSNDIYSGQPAAQLEYTNDADALWYDLSLIDGDPFSLDSVVVTPSAEQTNSCSTINCSDGLVSCLAEVYMQSNDNFATHSCSAGTDLTMEFCGASSTTKRAVRTHARSFKL